MSFTPPGGPRTWELAATLSPPPNIHPSHPLPDSPGSSVLGLLRESPTAIPYSLPGGLCSQARLSPMWGLALWDNYSACTLHHPGLRHSLRIKGLSPNGIWVPRTRPHLAGRPAPPLLLSFLLPKGALCSRSGIREPRRRPRAQVTEAVGAGCT